MTRKTTLAVYNGHNQDVVNHFADRTNDLLVVDFTQGAGWEVLCAFLGVDIPAMPFPHANNKTRERQGTPTLRRRLKVAKKRIKYAIQIAYFRSRGWLR